MSDIYGLPFYIFLLKITTEILGKRVVLYFYIWFLDNDKALTNMDTYSYLKHLHRILVSIIYNTFAENEWKTLKPQYLKMA